jgi:hypothetical protein
MWERVMGHVTINRPRISLQTQALVPEFRGLPPICADYGSALVLTRADLEAHKLKAMSIEREYKIILQPEPEGGFSVPELPSVATQGETIEEATGMARRESRPISR